MKQLDRLLFLQGNRCFFCAQPIPEGEESVEHITPVSAGGAKVDENCVVCCKAVNAALGSLSVKEKLRAVLSHRSGFACPHSAEEGKVTVALVASSAPPSKDLALVVPELLGHLKRMTANRPVKRAALANAVSTWFPDLEPDAIERVIEMMEAAGHVKASGSKLVYPSLDSPAAR